MWLFNCSPTEISSVITVINEPNGYQITQIVSNIISQTLPSSPSSPPNKQTRVIIPFPLAVHKDNGGFTLLSSSGVTDFHSFQSMRHLIRFYDNEHINIDINIIGDIKRWYVEDDYGFLSFIACDNFDIKFKHKISVSSKLFVPIKLAPIWVLKKVVYNVELHVVNNDDAKYLLPECLEKIGDNKYKIKNNYNYEFDIELETTNWESSDDE